MSIRILATGKPNIDNVNGKGATPNNQDVGYKGLRVLVTPSVFLKLALPLTQPHPDSLEFLRGHKHVEACGSYYMVTYHGQRQ